MSSTSNIATVEARIDRSSSSVVKDYYELTKPGITQMVALTTLAGYYVAIPTSFAAYASSISSWVHFLFTIVGTVLISGGSCVFNQITEREADSKMKRTATRPIPSGSVSVTSALIFGTVLSVIGAAMLLQVNVLTFVLAVATWLTYVVIYTPLKKYSTISLLVGGIPGALPFAGGWTAVRGSMDAPAWAFFAILFFWQLPHFLALSWMYKNDYREGGFAMTSVDDATGKKVALQTLITSILTTASCLLPTAFGVAGIVYTTGAVALGGWLSVESWRFLRSKSHSSARRVLLTSYAVLMGVLVLLIVDKI